ARRPAKREHGRGGRPLFDEGARLADGRAAAATGVPGVEAAAFEGARDAQEGAFAGPQRRLRREPVGAAVVFADHAAALVAEGDVGDVGEGFAFALAAFTLGDEAEDGRVQEPRHAFAAPVDVHGS